MSVVFTQNEDKVKFYQLEIVTDLYASLAFGFDWRKHVKLEFCYVITASRLSYAGFRPTEKIYQKLKPFDY